MARSKQKLTNKEIEVLKPADQEALQKLYKAFDRDCKALTTVINAIPHLLGLPAEFETDECVVQAYISKHAPAVPIDEVVPVKQMHLYFCELKYQFETDRSPLPIFVLIARYTWSKKLYVRTGFEMAPAEWTRILCDCFYQNGVPDELIIETALPKRSNDNDGECCKFNPNFLWFCEHLGMKRPKCIPSTAQQKKEMRQIAKKIQTVALPLVHEDYSGTDDIEDLDMYVQEWVECCESEKSKYVAYIGDQQFTGNANELHEIERKYLQFVDLPENAFMISMHTLDMYIFEKLDKSDFSLKRRDAHLPPYGAISILSTGHYQVLDDNGDLHSRGQLDSAFAQSLETFFNKGDPLICYLQRKKRNLRMLPH